MMPIIVSLQSSSLRIWTRPSIDNGITDMESGGIYKEK